MLLLLIASFYLLLQPLCLFLDIADAAPDPLSDASAQPTPFSAPNAQPPPDSSANLRPYPVSEPCAHLCSNPAAFAIAYLYTNSEA